ncbi:MAG: putative uptake transporter, substrate-binding protein/surface lipoprotein [Nitrososphaeraceae archaeon]|nr:putative uptake transporter, substrate-binding protein/surface lipoprotein [Nitrososphaeraceae archaeon]
MAVKGKHVAIIAAIGIVIAVIPISGQSFQLAAATVVSVTASTDQIMPVSTKHLKIALLTDALFSDAGWGAFAYNAGQAIKTKYSHEFEFKDNVAIPDIEATEGSFLLGALAGMMSKTGVIGYVGGDVTYPNLVNIFEGYKQGAKLMNHNVKVLVTYLDDFDNPAKGKEAAISQINAGADFLLHVADTSGHGVIEAAKENGIYAFGAVSDQNKLAPETVLTSFVLDVDKAYDQAVKMVQAGKFKGEIYKPGLEIGKGGVGDGIVYLAPFYGLENKVPEDVKLRLNQLTHDIINKKIIVPERYNR